MSKTIKILSFVLAFIFCGLFISACSSENNNIDVIPDSLKNEESGSPMLKVYNTSNKEIEEVDIEEYLLGVVVGEMYNTFEIEALKAQAILARTYAFDFLNTKDSKYEGADISNDITEAQAYSKENINDKIREAVSETKGIVVTKDGELIKAWFHANSGGITTLAKDGLNYNVEENFTKSIISPETEENSDNFSWGVVFKKTEILEALRVLGKTVNTITTFEVGEKDESGRAKTFIIGGEKINANEFRLKIGSTKLKSTLITNISVYANTIYIEGRGYGHGVGMSQWGANVLAKEGKTAEQIIKFYFDGVDLLTAY